MWVVGRFFLVEKGHCECCMASSMKGMEARNCESLSVLTDQHMFCVQESVYRDGKQNR